MTLIEIIQRHLNQRYLGEIVETSYGKRFRVRQIELHENCDGLEAILLSYTREECIRGQVDTENMFSLSFFASNDQPKTLPDDPEI